MFQTLHEISKNLIFVFVWKYVWKYVNINVSDIKKKDSSIYSSIKKNKIIKNKRYQGVERLDIENYKIFLKKIKDTQIIEKTFCVHGLEDSTLLKCQ